jgi:excisionase family DNA binding protein
MSEIVVLSKDDFVGVIERTALKVVEIALAESKPPREWMNTSQIAEYLSVSQGTIRKRIKNAGFPVNKKLGFNRFDRTAVDKWMRDLDTQVGRPPKETSED